jgi:hypothetical protein
MEAEMETENENQAGPSAPGETYNPWTIVNLVFHHLADQGLHPILGDSGDPGAPAADLLRALGIMPAAEGDRQVSARAKERLAELRAAFEESQGT